MPFFKYEIRYSDGNDCMVYDAIFWAPDDEYAEDHIFASVKFAAELEASDYYAAHGIKVYVEEGGDRSVEFTTFVPDSEGTTYSWRVSDPEVYELRPEHTYYHSRWQIGDLAEPPTQPVRISPSNIAVAKGVAFFSSHPVVNSEACTIVKFLRDTGDTWRPFTFGEYRLWCSVNEESPVIPGSLVAEGYLKAMSALQRDQTTLYVTDKLIHALFAERGVLAR